MPTPGVFVPAVSMAGGSSPRALNMNIGAFAGERVFVVCVNVNDNTDIVTGVTCGGVAMTQAVYWGDGVSDGETAIATVQQAVFAIRNPSVDGSGNAAVSITFSGDGTYGPYVWGYTVNDTDATTPWTLPATAIANGSSNAPSIASVTVPSGALAVASMNHNFSSTSTVTAGTEFTGSPSNISSHPFSVSSRTTSGVFSWSTGSSNAWVVTALIFSAVSAGDTTPPVITGPGGATGATSSVTINENTTAVHTFTANESVTWSLNGGADAALFTIGSGTGALAFASAPNFEAPADADTNNVYVVVVRATDGASPSNTTDQTVSVTVADVAEGTAPSITAQPSNASRKVGQTATFTVTATGTGTLTYQWQRNGSNISGATSASYTTPAVTVTGGTANNGDTFRCVVTGDTSPPATSNSATLTVTACSLDFTGITVGGFVGSTESSIARDDSVSYVWYVYAMGASLGSAIVTTSAVNTSAAGVPPAITDNALQFGTQYRVIGIRQTDNQMTHGVLAAS